MKGFPNLVLFICFFAIVGANAISAQERTITFGEYVKAEVAAREKENTLSRRVKRTDIYFRDGIETGREERLRENLLPDRWRSLYSRRFGTKSEKRETISISGERFCQTGNGPWSKKCPDVLSGIGIPSGTKYEYFYSRGILEGSPVNIFRSYAIYENTDGASEEDKGRMFIEHKLFMNDEAQMLRSEMNRGYVGTKKWESKAVTLYEYNPKDLKIEAPIK